MARHPRHIDVVAEGDGQGGVTFHMEENGVPVAKLKDAECLDFDKKGCKKRDDHEVRFKLVNKNGADVRFTTNLVNVLWVHKVADESQPCPSSAKHLPGEFFACEVSEDQKRLTVVNTNMREELVAFRMNFVPAGTEDVQVCDYIAYDPIGRNSNGGIE